MVKFGFKLGCFKAAIEAGSFSGQMFLKQSISAHIKKICRYSATNATEELNIVAELLSF